MSLPVTTWRHEQAIFNGVRFHYVLEGEGTPVLLLHGFPEFWYSWRHQIPALASAGYQAIAPDLRGYNLSEKPLGVNAYHINLLVDDIAAMLREWGGSAGGYLAGHDWGGLVAWYVAGRYPDLVRRLIILNAPHPNRYLEVLGEEPTQRLASYYVALFQIPWLPERLLRAVTPGVVRQLLRMSGLDTGSLAPEDAMRYRLALLQPGAATAAVNYYRSYFRRLAGKLFREPPLHISVPTLLLWGERDVTLVPANARRDRLSRWVPDLRVRRLDASHWVQNDAPVKVNRAMISFIREEEYPAVTHADTGDLSGNGRQR